MKYLTITSWVLAIALNIYGTIYKDIYSILSALMLCVIFMGLSIMETIKTYKVTVQNNIHNYSDAIIKQEEATNE